MKPKAMSRRARPSLCWLWACAFSGLATASPAVTLDFPGPATVTATRTEPLTSYRLPVGPWNGTAVETRLTEGALDQTAWRIEAEGVSSLALMQALRDQLLGDGWTVIFECETVACGGFDFRYGIEVLPEPDMHVDLGDFRYLAAERPADGGPERLSLLVSRSTVSGFVQLTRVGGAVSAPPEAAVSPQAQGMPVPEGPSGAPSDLGTRLEAGGAIALDDLVFPSGASVLAERDYASLNALAAYLAANPGRKVAIVGHTDASGSLEANIALSRKRAASVRQRLIDAHGVAPGQVEAEGVGYLSPRASNLTEEGRTRNRRVEIMLTSTQ